VLVIRSFGRLGKLLLQEKKFSSRCGPSNCVMQFIEMW
jgi:hypothetical protein